jgi:hypothetical protein
MDTVNVTAHAAPVFIFRAQEYRLDALKAQLPCAPLIEVSAADLNPPGVGEGPFQVQFSSSATKGPGEEVTFFKQEGKFTVLLGHLYVQRLLADGASHIRGRIISGPALKRARIDAPFVDESAQVPRQPAPVDAPVSTRARNTEPARAGQRRWRRNPPARSGAGERTHSSTPRFHKGG